jgi:hypothetical protein
LKEAPLVFTYFTTNKLGRPKEDINIRLIPFANVVLIGVPAPAKNAGDENSLSYGNLLAIPHEVGHYVFWHGEGTRGPYLDDEKWSELSPTDIWNGEQDDNLAIGVSVYNYQEEIFADVCSALIAGPLTALSSQFYLGKLREDDEDEFKKDDSDHPISVIRPYIYPYTLKALNNHPSIGISTSLIEWENQLKGKWDPRAQGIPKLHVKPKDSHKFFARLKLPRAAETFVKDKIDNGMNVDQNKLSEEIAVLVRNIVDYIRENSQVITALSKVSNNFWETFFTKDYKDVKQLDNKPLVEWNNLYLKFVQTVNKNINGDIPEWKNKPTLQNVQYKSLVNGWESAWKGIIGPKWVRIFKADGWTTEGPTNPWD